MEMGEGGKEGREGEEEEVVVVEEVETDVRLRAEKVWEKERELEGRERQVQRRERDVEAREREGERRGRDREEWRAEREREQREMEELVHRLREAAARDKDRASECEVCEFGRPVACALCDSIRTNKALSLLSLALALLVPVCARY